jgi:hypothetical protein
MPTISCCNESGKAAKDPAWGIQFSGPYMENNIFTSQRTDFQSSFCRALQEANSK